MWSAPQMGVPVFAGKCSPAEAKAVLQALPVSSGWIAIVRPIAVFCGFGLLLIVMWFWVPRLIWPEQYIGVLPGAGQAKWSSTSVRVKDGVFQGRPAPMGFQSGPQGMNMAPRGSAEATVVNPSHGFGQTRLGNRQGRRPSAVNFPGPAEPIGRDFSRSSIFGSLFSFRRWKDAPCQSNSQRRNTVGPEGANLNGRGDAAHDSEPRREGGRVGERRAHPRGRRQRRDGEVQTRNQLQRQRRTGRDGSSRPSSSSAR